MSSPVNNDINGLADAFEALTPNDWLALHQHSTAPDRSVIRRPTTNTFSSIQGTTSSVNLPATTLKIWPLVSPIPYKEANNVGSACRQNIGKEQPTLPKEQPALPKEPPTPNTPKFISSCVPEGVKVEIRGAALQSKPNKTLCTTGPAGFSPTPNPEMTPVERCAIPAVRKGNNVVMCIQSDKIAVSALLVPAIKRSLQVSNYGNLSQKRDYLKNSASVIGGHRIRMLAKATAPTILILAPTKDVAERVFEETISLTRRSSLNVILIRGGIDSRPQLQALQRGCDIVVATAGRLMDFLERGYISLSQVTTLILWEAGHMSNIGLQMKLRRIANFEGMSEGNHQTLVYTRAFPRRLETFCDSLMEEYTYVANDTTVSCLGITQKVEFVKDDAHRRIALLNAFRLISRTARTLVFVATKRTADSVTKWLVAQGVHVGGLHGGRSQEEREAFLLAFQEGRLPVLIATDVANHVFEQLPSVDLVVNFDMPTNIDAYIRRTGRTLASGFALALVSESCLPILPALANVLKQCNQTAPSWFHEMVLQASHEYDETGGAELNVKRHVLPLT